MLVSRASAAVIGSALCACSAVLGIDALQNVDCVGERCDASIDGSDGPAAQPDATIDAPEQVDAADATAPPAEAGGDASGDASDGSADADPCAGDASISRTCASGTVDVCSDLRACGACDNACGDPADPTRACIHGRCVDFTYVHWSGRDAGDYSVGDSGDVFDKTTSILWRRATSSTTSSLAEANRQCGLVGAGWRLPTRVELASLVNYDVPLDAAVEPTLFPDGLSSSCLWTLSPLDAGYSITIGGPTPLKDGYILGGFAFCDGRCVKRFAAAPADRFTIDLPSDTVIDRVTKLTWQRRVTRTQADAGVTLAWADATTACQGWSAGGRLPTIQELYTIVDERPADASVPTLVSPFAGEPPSARYWSSTGQHNDPGAHDPNQYKWYLASDGTSDTDFVGSTYYARCVRSGP